MKKIMTVIVLLGCIQNAVAAATDRYVRDVEKISTQYTSQMKSFL